MSPTPTLTRLNGRKVVLMVFGFGFLMVGSLWLYFEIQTRPFRTLTLALAAEFPESRPLVQGGQEKMHQQTPRLLRVLVTVVFDPKQNEAEFQKVIARVQRLCEQYHDLSPYDFLEIHLVKQRPGQEPVSRLIEIRLDSTERQ